MARYKANQSELFPSFVIAERKRRLKNLVVSAFDRKSAEGCTLEDKHEVLTDLLGDIVHQMENRDADPRSIPAPVDASV